jgi:hypothetical protein
MRMRSGIFGVALVAVAVCASTTAAEAQRGRTPPAQGMGYFATGWQRLDLGDLNTRLQTAGYQPFSEDFVSVGGGGFAVRQRVVIGGEGHAILGPSGTDAAGTLRTRLAGGSAMFNLGYVVARTPSASLAPMVGIGGGGLTLDILDRAAPTFDEVLQNPRRSARMTSGSLLLDASAMAQVRLTDGPRRDRPGRGGLAVGVRAGYTFAPFSPEWRTDTGNDIAAGPDTSLDGAYVRVMIGGWGARPRR